HIYKDSTNFSRLAAYLFPPASDKGKKKPKLHLDLDKIELDNNRFRLVNHNFHHHNRGVDFSDLEITEISGIFKNIQLDSVIQADIQKFTLKEKSGLHIQELTT